MVLMKEGTLAVLGHSVALMLEKVSGRTRILQIKMVVNPQAMTQSRAGPQMAQSPVSETLASPT